MVLIRMAVEADALLLLDTLKSYISESDFIPKYPEEMTLTTEQEASWIRSFLMQKNSLLLLAEYNGLILGNIDLTGNTRQMMQHTAVVGMGLRKDCRNIGLGTALMQHAIDWAIENPILELLWLQVYTANEAGIALYKKMKFEPCGLIPQFFKREVAYFDQLTMKRNVTS